MISSGITVQLFTENKSQRRKNKSISWFLKMESVSVLVATDIAARGLDIPLLPHVVNFELPNISEDYVHRIGRTGRAGASGEALSLVSADETTFLRDIEKLVGEKITVEIIEGFEPDPNASTAPIKQGQGGGGRRNNTRNASGGGNSRGGNSRGGDTSRKSNSSSGDRRSEKPKSSSTRESRSADRRR